MKNCNIKGFMMLFAGVMHMKCLKKINLSYNHTTIEDENVNKIK